MESETKRLARLRFEVGRAVQQANRIAIGEVSDTAEAVRDLARMVAALGRATDELFERQEEELGARV